MTFSSTRISRFLAHRRSAASRPLLHILSCFLFYGSCSACSFCCLLVIFSLRQLVTCQVSLTRCRASFHVHFFYGFQSCGAPSHFLYSHLLTIFPFSKNSRSVGSYLNVPHLPSIALSFDHGVYPLYCTPRCVIKNGSRWMTDSLEMENEDALNFSVLWPFFLFFFSHIVLVLPHYLYSFIRNMRRVDGPVNRLTQG